MVIQSGREGFRHSCRHVNVSDPHGSESGKAKNDPQQTRNKNFMF
jgi:hypothetical protein